MMNWSDYLAIYAAIISTIAIGWEIFSWYLSQARIRVVVSKGILVQTGDDSPKIFIRTINRGDKDIILHLFALKTKSGERLVFQEIPAKLEARNCHTVYRDEKYLQDASRPFIAIVVDATGKEYKSKPTTLN